ncbi:MAG TPA: hypothetical protein VGX37_05015, partial [Allosphingosinicella sp.]|nr:hypothetical protein [Allosphingosinicella sp.]
MPLLHPILAALLLVSAPAASPNLDRRPPIDECATDASFAAFRTQLREAVERQDRDFLLSATADDILVNFGG